MEIATSQNHAGRSMVDQMAAYWIRAEHDAGTEFKSLSLMEALDIARTRVRLVFAGEVRWSDASPGDRAVWIGRPRNAGAWAKAWAAQRDGYVEQVVGDDAMPPPTLPPEPGVFEPGIGGLDDLESEAAPPPGLDDLESEGAPPPAAVPVPIIYSSLRERTWWNVYDTVTLGAPGKSSGQARAFDCHDRVGDLSKTNMVVSRQFPGDQTFVVLNYYVVPTIAPELVPWDDIVGCLICGLTPRTPELPLSELYMGMMLPAVVIPTRMDFHFALTRLSGPDHAVPLRVHLEGLLTREIY